MTKRTVEVYRDSTKADLLHNVPIDDPEINTGTGVQPTSVEGLARIAKMMLVAEGKASLADCETFHYEVTDAEAPYFGH
jgi:hypothetical protein